MSNKKESIPKLAFGLGGEGAIAPATDEKNKKFLADKEKEYNEKAEANKKFEEKAKQ